jgi:hypothetical protein
VLDGEFLCLCWMVSVFVLDGECLCSTGINT